MDPPIQGTSGLEMVVKEKQHLSVMMKHFFLSFPHLILFDLRRLWLSLGLAILPVSRYACRPSSFLADSTLGEESLDVLDEDDVLCV